MMSRIAVAAALAAGLAAQPALAEQAVPVTQDVPTPDACIKSVNAMGASMSHTAETAADGRPMYRFVLRTNGLDYEVVCDAKTGLLGDVAPRASH
jgi:hypothetical protein